MPRGTRITITSRSNERLREAAAEFIAAHPETILIAPSHSAGEDLVHVARGHAGAHRLTLIQLAADLARPSMAALGLAPVTLLGHEALAARAVHHSRAADELEYFKPVAELPGFARALARTLGELRLGAVGYQQLASIGGRGEPCADLARLLARYQAELEVRKLADLARVFELATHAAGKDQHRWLDLPLVLLDVPLESEWHRRFFEKVAERAPEVLIASAPGETHAENSADDLDAASSPLSAMEHLRRYLFDEESPAREAGESCLEMFSAPGEGLEAVEIARRILRLAREGVAFDRMAILLRSPERYQPMIEDALRRAKIPAYFSRGSARPDPGGRAFLALLLCAAEKCSASRFAEYLSLGQVPPAGANQPDEWVAPSDELLPGADSETEAAATVVDEARVLRAPAAWEKLLVDAAVIGGRDRWQRRLRGLEREYELRLQLLERDDDSHREYFARRLDQLRQLETFALPLIEILDALPKETHWADWIVKLGELARAALRQPDPVIAVLAELEPMGDVGPVGLEEVAEVLSDRLGFLRNARPDRRYGRLFIASIDEARGRAFDVVFLPGLAEGIFPQRAFEDPLMLDAFRRQAGGVLKLRDDRVDEERGRLSLAAAAARVRLIASYPRMDVAEGRPRVPSFYALELPRAADGKLPELKAFEREASSSAPARLNWPAPSDRADAIDDIEYDLVSLRSALDRPGQRGSARYLMEANPRLARSLRTRYSRWHIKKWAETDGLITHNPGALTGLAEHRLNARAWSASSLQQFAACPYKFALHGIYGLRPRDEASPIEQLDPLTRGGLFHAIQFALLNELKRRELLPVRTDRLAETLQIADKVLDEMRDRYEEELAPAIPRVWKSEIEDIRTDLRGWLQHVASNDDEWLPIHFELAFGLANQGGTERDSASIPNEVELTELGVRLRGSIDLVERNVAQGVLRVTDHKTGKCPETIPHYVGGGRFLQPLLYGQAAQQLLGMPVASGRLFYSTQAGGYQHAVLAATDKSRAFLARLLENIDGAIAVGFLPPAPQKDTCANCDYRSVCGPYEEQRAARNKDRNDERLDPLTEIRGML